MRELSVEEVCVPSYAIAAASDIIASGTIDLVTLRLRPDDNVSPSVDAFPSCNDELIESTFRSLITLSSELSTSPPLAMSRLDVLVPVKKDVFDQLTMGLSW